MQGLRDLWRRASLELEVHDEVEGWAHAGGIALEPLVNAWLWETARWRLRWAYL